MGKKSRGRRTIQPSRPAPSGDATPEIGDASLGAQFQRIQRRCEQMGLTDRQLCLAVGRSADWLRNAKRQWKTGKQDALRPDAIPPMAKVLRTTVEWILRGEGPEVIGGHPDLIEREPPRIIAAPNFRGDQLVYGPTMVSATSPPGAIYAPRPIPEGSVGLPLRYSIGAAVRENQQIVETATFIAPDPRYRVDQFVVEVRDISLNRIALPGDLLLIADLGEPRAGDLVLLSRAKQGFIQWSVRRLTHREADTIEMQFETDDPRSGELLHLKHDGTTYRCAHDDKVIVVFFGVVIGLYRSLG